MKAEIQDLKDSFKLGYEAFYESRKEAEEVWNQYHNRHYTPEQIAWLESQGRPKETFNVVKLFARMLIGYYSTIVNTIKVVPIQYSDVTVAAMLNDVINYEFDRNRFDLKGDNMKLGALVSGLLCSYVNVKDTGKRDNFRRPIYAIDMDYVPDYEIVMDPASVADDYSDGRFLHRFRWFTKDALYKLIGKAKTDSLTPFNNFTDADEADYEYRFTDYFTGQYRVDDSYLVIHTVMEDEDGKRWSILWHDDTIISKDEITYKDCRWPYRVQKLHTSNQTEYYGIFREVIEAQKAINQAVLKVQQMVNVEKVFVQEGAVENIEDFTRLVNRVNAVIPVLQLSGIKIEKLNAEVQNQYMIIERALDRIQRILGINDSFLGMAYASDSGRKVKLQQNATIMSLRYVTARIQAFYASLGKDVGYLIKQYYTASQVLNVTDEIMGERWVSINQPMQKFSGQLAPNGQPIYQPILMEKMDPANGKPMVDEQGNIVLAPVNEPDTEFTYSDFDVRVDASAFNDEDEQNQLVIETMMSGQMGQMMAQVNPAGFFKIGSMALKVAKTRYSGQMAEIFEQTAQMLQGNQGATQEAKMMASGQTMQQPMSQSMKLPTNTNEGI